MRSDSVSGRRCDKGCLAIGSRSEVFQRPAGGRVDDWSDADRHVIRVLSKTEGTPRTRPGPSQDRQKTEADELQRYPLQPYRLPDRKLIGGGTFFAPRTGHCGLPKQLFWPCNPSLSYIPAQLCPLLFRAPTHKTATRHSHNAHSGTYWRRPGLPIYSRSAAGAEEVSTTRASF